MFGYMPAPPDTSVLREIIIVCCESVGNCQTLYKDGPLQLVTNIKFLPFSLFFLSDGPPFLPIFVPLRGAPTTCFVIVFMFINRQLFVSRDIQSYDCIFGFQRKE